MNCAIVSAKWIKVASSQDNQQRKAISCIIANVQMLIVRHNSVLFVELFVVYLLLQHSTHQCKPVDVLNHFDKFVFRLKNLSGCNILVACTHERRTGT